MFTKFEQIVLGLIFDDNTREALWQDVAHIDEGTDLALAIATTKIKMQYLESLNSLKALVADSLQLIEAQEKDLKKIEFFEKKLLTND